MPSDKAGIVLHCCECDEETPHEEVHDDEFFEFGLMCRQCHIVWEANKEDKEEEEDNAENK